jgi:hypothetical protein
VSNSELQPYSDRWGWNRVQLTTSRTGRINAAVPFPASNALGSVRRGAVKSVELPQRDVIHDAIDTIESRYYARAGSPRTVPPPIPKHDWSLALWEWPRAEEEAFFYHFTLKPSDHIADAICWQANAPMDEVIQSGGWSVRIFEHMTKLVGDLAGRSLRFFKGIDLAATRRLEREGFRVTCILQ